MCTYYANYINNILGFMSMNNYLSVPVEITIFDKNTSLLYIDYTLLDYIFYRI